MSTRQNIKKRIFIIIPIILFIIFMFIILYPIIKNSNYIDDIKNDIYDNTDIKDILYINKDNNYYMVKSKDRVYVFDLNYDEVYSIELELLYDSDMDLVYRRNNLYYMERIRENYNLIYKFYDIISNEFVYESRVGG